MVHNEHLAPMHGGGVCEALDNEFPAKEKGKKINNALAKQPHDHWLENDKVITFWRQKTFNNMVSCNPAHPFGNLQLGGLHSRGLHSWGSTPEPTLSQATDFGSVLALT